MCAAYCYCAAARCEKQAGASSSEAERYIHAAQEYIQAEMDDLELRLPGYELNIADGIRCYDQAIDIYIRNRRTAFAATLCMEVAHVLLVFKRVEDATRYFDMAASHFDDVSAFWIRMSSLDDARARCLDTTRTPPYWAAR